MRVLLVTPSTEVWDRLESAIRSRPDVELERALTEAEAARTLAEGVFDLRLASSPIDLTQEFVAELVATGPTAVLLERLATADVQSAVRAGAFEVMSLSEINPRRIAELLGRAVRMTGERGSSLSSSPPQRTWATVGLTGHSPAMRRLRRHVRRIATAEAPVLIGGETGTGKELVARAIHRASPRASGPCITVNCSALAGPLESTLFGHRKGAFPGADRDVQGQLELAGDGTVILDEIADMPHELQAELLRAMEEGRFRPLGATTDIPLTARIVVTTRVDLEERMQSGRFRSDLYYRLNVVQLDVPPLQERLEDFEALLDAFAAELPRTLQFTVDAIHWLQRRRWRGNLRELRNAVERLSLLCESSVIEIHHLEEFLPPAKGDFGTLETMAKTLLGMSTAPDSKLDAIESAVVYEAMSMSGGNKSAAARLIGIDRKALERRWEKLQQQEYVPERSSGVLRVAPHVPLDAAADSPNS